MLLHIFFNCSVCHNVCFASASAMFICANSNKTGNTKHKKHSCFSWLWKSGIDAKMSQWCAINASQVKETHRELHEWWIYHQAACEDYSSWCWVLSRLEAFQLEQAAPGSRLSSRPEIQPSRGRQRVRNGIISVHSLTSHTHIHIEKWEMGAATYWDMQRT